MDIFILFGVDLQVTFSKLLAGTSLKVQKHKQSLAAEETANNF